LRDDDERGRRPQTDWLTGAERARYEGFAFEKRRREWLLGRRAAKELVRDLLRDRLGCEVPPAAIEVASADSGAPIVLSASPGVLPWAAGTRLPLELSLSHSFGVALCGAFWQSEDQGACPSLGVDLERVAFHAPDVLRDYLTPEERHYWITGEGLSPDERVMLVWSGKEAALKALGKGLAVDARLVTCLPDEARGDSSLGVEPESDWRTLSIRCAPDLAVEVTRSAGRWRIVDGFALTLAVLWRQPLR
jgi:4'-phosphopantetheinyl transferase